MYISLDMAWQKWQDEVRITTPEFEYGDYVFNAMAAFDAKHLAWLNSPYRQFLLTSDCAQCRESAINSLYPPHVPNVEGHVPHCTCNRCF